MVSSEDVRSETRRILGEANLDEASGKSIRVKVGEALQLSKEQSSSFRPIIEVQLSQHVTSHLKKTRSVLFFSSSAQAKTQLFFLESLKPFKPLPYPHHTHCTRLAERDR